MSTEATELHRAIANRRTFAIISHPDAGKTTLTEKLLLYGGAIHLAGAVKAKRNQRHTTSDWMELEKERGISINTTVLQFQYGDTHINLLDTPGHEDFSEDTYRTLIAADAAVMLIDAAKGVEPQTRKLFEVCRMRAIPIFTFINKLDRPGQEPLDLIDELERVLGIRSSPVTWPIGMGDRFRGVYNLQDKRIRLFQQGDRAQAATKLESIDVEGIDDPKFVEFLADIPEVHEQLQTELELVELAGDPLDLERVRRGDLTPVFFGSAMNNFGVESFLKDFIRMAPQPLAREADIGEVAPQETRFSAFVFKLQANMDPQHRDKVAFIRVCSGHFERNQVAKHMRLKKDIKLARPLQFFGQERVVVEEAWPGDIIGLVDTTDCLRIGDTLCEGGAFRYAGVPSFSPEHFARVLLEDPLKRKQLQKGLTQIAEEGVVQIYRHPGQGDRDPVLAAIGVLQFDVLRHRLKIEYGVDARIESLPFSHARWIDGPIEAGFFEGRTDSQRMVDRDGLPVALFRSDWSLRWAEQNNPGVQFLTNAPLGARD